MSFLDSALGALGGSGQLDAIAAKVGMSPDQVQAAVAALGQQHDQPGDTAEGAAAQTGLPLDQVQQVLAHLGGEGALGSIAGALGGTDGMLGKITGALGGSAAEGGGGVGGLLSGLFGKK